MNNPTEIANWALACLDLGPITSLEDPKTPEAKRVAAIWPAVFASFLQERRWSFALRRDKPARLVISNPDSMPLPYAFAQPEDLIRLLAVHPAVEYLVMAYEAGKRPAIFAARETITIEYLSDKVNIADMQPKAQEALALKLASELCLDLHNNTQRASGLYQRYMLALDQAATVDYQTHTPFKVRADAYNTARLL